MKPRHIHISFLLALCVFALIRCNVSSSETAKQIAKINLVYAHDLATGLCFSMQEYGGYVYSNTMSYIPCDSLKNVKVYWINSRNASLKLYEDADKIPSIKFK